LNDFPRVYRIDRTTAACVLFGTLAEAIDGLAADAQHNYLFVADVLPYPRLVFPGEARTRVWAAALPEPGPGDERRRRKRRRT
jgi:hypothetical protein